MTFRFIKSKRVLLHDKLQPGVIEVKEGKISHIYYNYDPPELEMTPAVEIIDAGNMVVMPGLVDTHTHVNEPGRTEWEGFWTATRAAAAGGFTTIVDMPLQCTPATTSVAALNLKLEAAKGKCHVDVKFWGGAIGNPEDMKALLKAGVAGFKCFLITTTMDDFPHLNEQQADEALGVLEGTGSVLQFHAELDHGEPAPQLDGEHYKTLLDWRRPSMEVNAIKLIDKLMRKHRNVRVHIVHLSATESLDIIKGLKKDGFPITVETCPHYLHFSEEDIGAGWTEYLALPPIRDASNRERLWRAIAEGDIDSIAADHANCTPDRKPRKFTDEKCWGGIAGLQFGLPVVWTNARKRGYKVEDVCRLMSKNTGKLASVDHNKCEIKVGYDADFVIWNPEEEVTITGKIIEFKNKLTPYHGMKFYGNVHKTILRGNVIYDEGIFAKPQGEFIFHDWEAQKFKV